MYTCKTRNHVRMKGKNVFNACFKFMCGYVAWISASHRCGIQVCTIECYITLYQAVADPNCTQHRRAAACTSNVRQLMFLCSNRLIEHRLKNIFHNKKKSTNIRIVYSHLNTLERRVRHLFYETYESTLQIKQNILQNYWSFETPLNTFEMYR